MTQYAKRIISPHLGGLILGHGGLLDERLAGLLEPRGVVDKQARALDLHGDVRNLMLHGLKVEDALAELAALARVGDGSLKAALGEADHLGADADAALVEYGDGVLVAVADRAEHLALVHAAIVEVEGARGAGSQAHLILALADGQTGRVTIDHEARDALVAEREVDTSHDEEDACVSRVRYPLLGAVDCVVLALFGRGGAERERVRARLGLGQAKRANLCT